MCLKCAHHSFWGQIVFTFIYYNSFPTSLHEAPGGSKILPFMYDGGHCAHWDLQLCSYLSIAFPRSVPWYNPVSEVYRQLLGLHVLVCALTCTANNGTSLKKCVLFQIITNQLNLPVCRNFWRMISGNRMHLSSLLRVMANAVNTYAIFLLLLLIWNKFANVSNKFVSLCHYEVLCEEFEIKD